MAHDSSAPEIDTTQEVGQAGDGVLTENPVDSLGHRLAGEYTLARKLTREPRLLHLLDHQERRLDHAYQRFSNAAQADVAPSYAAEWLLDNYFVVQQAIRQVREDMPLGYYQQLPKLKNTSWATYPRVYALARESIAYSNCQLHIGDTVRLIQAFQADGESLTMGELWAFPTMLRLGILDSLTS